MPKEIIDAEGYSNQHYYNKDGHSFYCMHRVCAKPVFDLLGEILRDTEEEVMKRLQEKESNE